MRFAVTNQFRGVAGPTSGTTLFRTFLSCRPVLTDTYESALVIATGSWEVRRAARNEQRAPAHQRNRLYLHSGTRATGAIDARAAQGRVVLGYKGPSQPSGPKNMDDFWAMGKES